MRRCPRASRCWVAAKPPAKLVDPTLVTRERGRLIGSMTTSGKRARASAASVGGRQLADHGDHRLPTGGGELTRPLRRIRCGTARAAQPQRDHDGDGAVGAFHHDALQDLGRVRRQGAVEHQLDGWEAGGVRRGGRRSRVRASRLSMRARVVGATSGGR